MSNLTWNVIVNAPLRISLTDIALELFDGFIYIHSFCSSRLKHIKTLSIEFHNKILFLVFNINLCC